MTDEELQEMQLTLTMRLQAYITLNKQIMMLQKELVEAKVKRAKLENMYQDVFDEFEDIAKVFGELDEEDQDPSYYKKQ